VVSSPLSAANWREYRQRSRTRRNGKRVSHDLKRNLKQQPRFETSNDVLKKIQEVAKTSESCRNLRLSLREESKDVYRELPVIKCTFEADTSHW